MHPIKAALRNQVPRMSQAQLARRLGIGEATISRWLNGKETPPENFFSMSADILGVSESSLRASEPTGAAA